MIKSVMDSDDDFSYPKTRYFQPFLKFKYHIPVPRPKKQMKYRILTVATFLLTVHRHECSNIISMAIQTARKDMKA